MKTPKNAMPIAALIVSMASIVMAAMATQSSAKKEYVETVEKRVVRLEYELDRCQKENTDQLTQIEQLQRENVRLMREALKER